MAVSWLSPNAFAIFSSSTPTSCPNSCTWESSKFHFYPSPRVLNCRCKHGLSSTSDLSFVLHDALDLSEINTDHARAARVGFCSQIEKLSNIERETSISANRGVTLHKVALHIAAEDDSIVSHSSVPLPVDDFIERLDSLSLGYCSHYSSSLRSSPEIFLECLERYLYVDKGFRRANARNQVDHRALYLHSVLTHRMGSVSMLSLIYSDILKMLHMLDVLSFDVEIFLPHDPYSSPRGYQKQKSKESDQGHIMTSQSLLVKILKDLKNAFWPFQIDHTISPFLRAAHAAQRFTGSTNTKESPLEIASAKAAQNRLQRGVWTSACFGDMRRALSACERLILLKTDPKDLRDYAALLYHCGFYEESLQYLKVYQVEKKQSSSIDDTEEDAVEKLMFRLNLVLMEEGWSRRPVDKRNLFNSSEPW